MSERRFAWDGDEFPLLNNDDDWTGRECVAVEDYFGQLAEKLDRTRRFYAVVWVGIHRKRPDFTLDEALEIRASDAVTVPDTAPAAPGEPEPEPEPEPEHVSTREPENPLKVQLRADFDETAHHHDLRHAISPVGSTFRQDRARI